MRKMTENKTEFDTLLKKAAELRGHLCLGLPLGIKMSQMGLRLLDMTEDERREKLVVFMENDKCPADAIQIATGCTAGSRKLKMMYYGKSAATFVNCATGKAYRIISKKDLTPRAIKLATKVGLIKPGEKVDEFSKLERIVLMNAFMKLKPEDLFDFQEVKITWKSPLLPTKKEQRQFCAECGEEIMSGMGITCGNAILCKPCVEGPYFKPV